MTNKNKKHIVIATAIIILIVALLIYRYYIPDMKPKKQATPLHQWNTPMTTA